MCTCVDCMDEKAPRRKKVRTPSIYHEVLGVGVDASAVEIRRAFRRLALKFHPDVNKEAGAEERFKEIYEAYQALSNLGKHGEHQGKRELACDMCMGTGAIISRWTQVLGGVSLRCPKCLGSGKDTPPRRVNHTPLNCTCPDCNRQWAEWKRRNRPTRQERPRGVIAQAEEIRASYPAKSHGPERPYRPRSRRQPQAVPQPKGAVGGRSGRGVLIALGLGVLVAGAVLVYTNDHPRFKLSKLLGGSAPASVPMAMPTSSATQTPTLRHASTDTRPSAQTGTLTPVRAAAPTPAPTENESVATGADSPSSGRYPGGKPLDKSAVEKWVLHYTSEARQTAGLEPLIHDPSISDIARAHSDKMIQFGLYHNIQGHGPTDRALAAGYNCRAYYADGSYTYGLSENIAEHPRVTEWLGIGLIVGPKTWRPEVFDSDSQAMARGLVAGWMLSPGHKANILDEDARRIGIGIAIRKSQEYRWTHETVFATQNFSSCK